MRMSKEVVKREAMIWIEYYESQKFADREQYHDVFTEGYNGKMVGIVQLLFSLEVIDNKEWETLINRIYEIKEI